MILKNHSTNILFLAINLAVCFVSHVNANEKPKLLDLQNETRELILQNSSILTKYPELARKAFGTSDITILKKAGYIPSAFKRLCMESKEFTTIIAGAILAAIAYGIILDQISARVSLEFFSEGIGKHVMMSWDSRFFSYLRTLLINSKSPTVHGLIWGTISSWWMGALVGIPVAAAARTGSPLTPGISAKELIKPTCITLASIGLFTLASGLTAYMAFKNDPGSIQDFMQKNPGILNGIPASGVHRYLTVASAQTAAYVGGVVGGVGLLSYVIYRRYKKTHKINARAEKLIKEAKS